MSIYIVDIILSKVLNMWQVVSNNSYIGISLGKLQQAAPKVGNGQTSGKGKHRHCRDSMYFLK